MREMKRYVIIYAIVFVVMAASIVGVALYHQNEIKEGYVDENGYRHTHVDPNDIAEASTFITPNETNYVVSVPEDIEESFFKSINEGTSGYEFLSYALPFANGTKEYVILKFSDNTGVYITSTNQSSAIYGEVDGQDITYDIGYINISGMNMIYEAAPDYASKESRILAKLIPDEYQTDGLYVRVSKDSVYICITANKTPSLAADEIYNMVKDSIEDVPLIVLVNDSYKYEYNSVMPFEDISENDEAGIQ